MALANSCKPLLKGCIPLKSNGSPEPCRGYINGTDTAIDNHHLEQSIASPLEHLVHLRQGVYVRGSAHRKCQPVPTANAFPTMTPACRQPGTVTYDHQSFHSTRKLRDSEREKPGPLWHSSLQANRMPVEGGKVSFFQLSLIAAVALLGPLLALPRKWHFPVVLGQLLAGIAIGRTGLDLVDSSEATFTFVADVGFALVMFVAGTHVPVRDEAIRPALGAGALRAGIAAVLAAVVGIGIAVAFGTGHASLYIVLLASSSAVWVRPIVDSLRLRGPKVLTTTAQVAVADIACIVALPLAVDPSNATRAAAGVAVVAACAAVLFFVLV